MSTLRKTDPEYIKIKEKANKLREMAERGEFGESENARTKLMQLLKSKNLRWDDIFGNEMLRQYIITNANESGAIFKKVITSIDPTAKVNVYEHTEGQAKVKVVLSEVDHIEVREKFSFFWNAYKKDREEICRIFNISVEIYHHAFLNKHAHYFLPEITDTFGHRVTMEAPVEVFVGGRPSFLDTNEQSLINKVMKMMRSLNYVKTRRTLEG